MLGTLFEVGPWEGGNANWQSADGLLIIKPIVSNFRRLVLAIRITNNFIVLLKAGAKKLNGRAALKRCLLVLSGDFFAPNAKL